MLWRQLRTFGLGESFRLLLKMENGLVNFMRLKPSIWLPDLWHVVATAKENQETVTLQLQPVDDTLPRLFGKPGQFNMVYSPGRGEIPISVSSSRAGVLHHTIRKIGAISEALAGLNVGEQLGLRGPFGSPWPLDEAIGKTLVFLAGGVGLASIRPAIEYALDHLDRFRSVYLLYGARDPQHLIFKDDFAVWQEAGLVTGITVDHADSSWEYEVGPLPLLLNQYSFPVDQTIVFVCGPEIMMRLAADKLVALGMHETQIYLSMERNMKCAVGICGHCQYGPEFLCRDGPVLRYDRIAAFLGVKEL